MAKQSRVPGTRAQPLNREQRRHPEKMVEKGERHERPQDEAFGKSPRDEMGGADRVQDDLSVRAKSSGHGKKTADKWNQ